MTVEDSSSAEPPSAPLAETRDEGSLSPVVMLAEFTLLVGAGGMLLSFAVLATGRLPEMLAGAVGFIGGAVLVAAGEISLSLQSRSPATSRTALHTAGSLAGCLPPTVAALSWIAGFSIFSVLGIFGMFAALVGVPLTLVGCIVWSWGQSLSVAGHLSELFQSPRVRLLRAAVFAMQTVAIVATWPLFAYFVHLLESWGYIHFH